MPVLRVSVQVVAEVQPPQEPVRVLALPLLPEREPVRLLPRPRRRSPRRPSG
jgi:hypothetical protein